MKIISKGNGHRWWVGARVTCLSCGSEVELEDGDCVRLSDPQDSRESGSVYIDCPVCYSVASTSRVAVISSQEIIEAGNPMTPDLGAPIGWFNKKEHRKMGDD